MSAIYFKKAGIIDPATNFYAQAEIFVEDGIITGFVETLSSIPSNCEIIDCDGHALMPGIIDMRVSTGEPGAEHRETLKTAGRAAVAGCLLYTSRCV